jgi:predicted lipoprotein
MKSLASAAASAAGRQPLPPQLLAPMEHQVQLIEEILGRERRLQQELLTRAFEPFNAVFDLLEQSATALHRQAEALRESSQALEQAAEMIEVQAATFERTISALREPGEIVKRAVGADRGREEQ